MTNPLDLTQALLFLAGVGGPMVVAYALSLIAENWKKWNTFPRWVKFITPILACIVLAIFANVALRYTAVIEQVQPWYQIIVSSILAWLSTQKALMDTKKAGYGITPEKLDRYGQ